MTAMQTNQTHRVKTSDYDTENCDIGIVHIGYGAFHRAHQAVYIDDYMNSTNDLRWGIAAVNLRASEAEPFANSSQVTHGYILKTTTPDDAQTFKRIKAHRHFSDWSENKQEAESLLSLKTVHIVSITVTESGYYLNPDFSLDVTSPIINAELKGNDGQSVYSFLSSALKKRQQAHGQPLNILCCDNIRSNGKMLERNFKDYLQRLGEDDLLKWIEQNVSFPCSMVDRITPRAGSDLINEIAQLTGDNNSDPIHAEDFIQWVLANKFKAPMPQLEKVGVEVVEDVDPYEEAKIRILNGGHTGLCYFGAIKGHSTYDQAILDDELRAIFDAFESREVLPGLDIKIPFDKLEYLEQIALRFSNGAIADQLERICMDGYSKFPIFIKPTLQSCLKQGIEPINGYLCIASWYVYARRFAKGQVSVVYHEPYWGELEPMLANGAEIQFAKSEKLWAEIPKLYPTFIDGILAAIREVETRWPV